ncbi:MAG TPA: response regulator, partial [Gammaproteobacteria bacterium]|nr:response regulator [Gammaproteobacteria bacterium]HIJ31166.1 response regulator [Gammaproteobacteria bacterium]
LAGVESAGRRQLALVNDILDMSKLESGKFSINEIPYDLMVLVTEVEHMLSAYAKDSGLDFVITQKSDEPYLLIGDGQRIGQILINLIGNAIKFTEKGKVKLTVWNNQNYLFFNVEDTGIGMAPDTIDKLFERFEQIDGAISRRFGGSGLGLFISENLANLMGGQIDVSSIEGKGSIFQLLLPYRRSSIPVKPVDERPTNSVLNEKLSGHVLIAEDTPELQLLERRILEGMGLTVSLAVDGGEVMEMVKQHSFDLILMDMQMPVLDGIEATKIIRDCGDQTTVIALTANVMQKHRDAFTAAGCDDFLSKPIDKQELRRILKFYLSKSHE